MNLKGKKNYGYNDSPGHGQHSVDDRVDHIGIIDDNPRHRPFLRRAGETEERAERPDAVPAHRGRGEHRVGGFRLQPGVRHGADGERQPVGLARGRLRQGDAARHHAGHAGGGPHPRTGVRALPVHVRRHHPGPDTGRVRRAREVLGLPGVHGAVVPPGLHPHGPLGVGRRLPATDGGHRLCRRHGGTHQRGHLGPGDGPARGAQKRL